MSSLANYSQPLALTMAPTPPSGLSVADGNHSLSQQPAYTVMLTQMPMQNDGGAGKVTVVHVREIIRYLREFWRIGAICGACVAALVFVMLGLGTKVYETESKVEVRIQEASLLRLDNLGGGLTEQSAIQIVNNHRTNLRTRRFVDYVYNQMPAAERSAYIAGTDQVGWKRKLLVQLGLGEMPPKLPPEDRFSAKIDQTLRVEPVKDSHVLRIVVQDGDPLTASRIANHYAQSYLSYVENERSLTATNAQDRLSEKVKEAKAKLDASELELAAFSQQADLLKSGESADMSTLNAEKLAKADSELDVELLRAQQRVLQLRSLLAAGGEIGGVRGVGDDPQIIEIQKRLIEAKTRQAMLLESCGPRHPKLVQTLSEITRLQGDNKARIENLVQGAESEERRLKNEKTEMANLLVSARLKAFGQSPNRTRLKQLSDEVESQRQLYADLSKHQELARLTAELGGNTQLAMIDTASEPDDPVKPRKSLAFMASILCFGFIGLALPVGIGLTQDHVVPLFKPLETAPQPEGTASAASAYAYTQAPPSTTHMDLPPRAVNPPSDPSIPLPQRASPFANLRVLTRMPDLRSEDGPMQLSEVLHDPRLFGDRTFIQIASLIEETKAPNSGPVILLITSATAGEGKSLLAAALSASLCTVGRSVLLIDGNPNAPGLPTYFPQTATFSALAPDLEALRYGQMPLFLLPTNDLPSGEMTELIDGYRAWIRKARASRIDWIIIDGGALLPSFADVAQLASLATDTILVNESSRCDMRQMKAALNLLRPVVAAETIRGIVLNRQS